MVYFKDSQTWVQQSTLLLEARPTTARISTRYKLSPPNVARSRRSKLVSATTDIAEAPPPPSRAYIVLKTYDPVSGTCLKYRTDKTAEIGRLVAGLGKCARTMAAMPVEEGAEKGEGQEMDDMADPMKSIIEGKPAGASVETKSEGKETKPTAGKAGGGKKKKGKR
ncbi:hypothetical protein MMC26_000891 [Xylographa opegraphella]|nr:hypothetical protein [Xylographa opegraphella]